jgi:predicted AAA+ superfamily ATPase
LSDRIDEYIAEGERSRKRLDKRMGDFANTLGELIETLIAARLWEKFPEYKLARAYQRIMIYDENNKPKTDIDILLSNDIWAMVVEVKREANIGDIDHHLKRMELVRKYPPTDILGK